MFYKRTYFARISASSFFRGLIWSVWVISSSCAVQVSDSQVLTARQQRLHPAAKNVQKDADVNSLHICQM